MADRASIGSICPQGWTLPPNAGDGSYNNLLKTTYGISSDSRLVVAPFDFAYTGLYLYSSGELDYTGSGNYWSHTAKDASNAYNLYFDGGGVLSQNYNTRGTGRAVRCVAKKNSLFASFFARQSANGTAETSIIATLRIDNGHTEI